ncbi:hypothetical protein M569_15751 [Genlisea aurea]|uniref:Hyaluronan/mRNA-binding protein domain-containing protein n=1 Tax=Genlisea aurea TaxID=192259 RepID=S8BXF8_9LAMI|nr:hypothetical protein M569_15751 [Genlisea aurea]
MATLNPFDLLGDDDAEDPSLLIAAHKQKAADSKKDLEPATKGAAAAVKQPLSQNKVSAASQGKLPSKPLPPSLAVREARSESARGGRGFGRGGRGGEAAPYRNQSANENIYRNSDAPAGHGFNDDAEGGKPSERRAANPGGPRNLYRGGRRGEFGNGDDAGDGERDRPPRRPFDRRSGTGRGNEFKREGAGRGNWGTKTDELAHVPEEIVNEDEKQVNEEKPLTQDEVPAEGDKEEAAKEVDEKEPENKEMTLEEYEKLLEEKRKALLALKSEERKVDSKEFESMQQISNKKANDDVFIKLGSDKDRKKELAEKEDKAKKSVSINEFLKPAEGERYYNPGGRGRGGRGRGSRGGYAGGGGGGGGGEIYSNNKGKELAIEDPGQFPNLGGGK